MTKAYSMKYFGNRFCEKWVFLENLRLKSKEIQGSTCKLFNNELYIVQNEFEKNKCKESVPNRDRNEEKNYCTYQEYIYPYLSSVLKTLFLFKFIFNHIFFQYLSQTYYHPKHIP